VVGPIHVTRSGKISARVKVGINSDGVDLYKPQMFETEAEVRAIMNEAAKADEVKKDEGRATTSKKFTIQKLKSMAEHKMVYCNLAVDNHNQRASAVASTGTARLTGTQKLHQELQLERELRTVRPARPRPPITAVGAVPLRGQGRKRTREDADEADQSEVGAKRQVTESRGRGGGRGGGRARGRGRGNRGGSQGSGSDNVNGWNGFGGGGNRGGSQGSGSDNVNGWNGFGGGGSNNRGSRGNWRGRGHSVGQPIGSPFQQQQQHQQNILPPSMHQALINSLPAAFVQQYTEWNGGGNINSEANPVVIEDNHY
jgi:hypothetical protein